MPRLKVWQNNSDIGQIGSWTSAHVTPILTLDAGYSLLRSRIFLELSLYSQWSGDFFAYPTPWRGWSTAAALCWSAAGPPAGYYSELFADWLFVAQVAFDVVPFLNPIDPSIPGYVSYNTYCRNTIETRVIDTESQRLATEPTTLYLVIDSQENVSVDSSQWIPDYRWTSRCLTEQPLI